MDGNRLREIAAMIAEKTVSLHRLHNVMLWLVHRSGAAHWLWKHMAAWQWSWCRDDTLPPHDAVLLCSASMVADGTTMDEHTRAVVEGAIRQSRVYPEIEEYTRKWGEVKIALFSVRCSAARLIYMRTLQFSRDYRCLIYTAEETGEPATAPVACAGDLCRGKFWARWPVSLDTSQLEALLARVLGIAVPAAAPEEGPEVELPGVPVEVPEVRLPELEVEL